MREGRASPERSALQLLLLFCAATAVVATPPTCANVGEACSTSMAPPPSPPLGDCLPDGATWTSDPLAECCSGYPFGPYCTCVPEGADAQKTALECCSRNTAGAGLTCAGPSPPPSPPGLEPPSPPPPPACLADGEPCTEGVDLCCDSYCKDGICQCGCFPPSATLQTLDRGAVAMPDLRPGDRVLSVGWDGRLAYEEIYAFGHRTTQVLSRYYRVQVLGREDEGAREPRTLRLTATHHLVVGSGMSDACLTLAGAFDTLAAPDATLAWERASQHLSWASDHVMALPPSLTPGMVAWVAGNGTAQPACILSVNSTLEVGGYTPFVRARGIVVDGVVASPHDRWNDILGYHLLPKSLHAHVPAIMEVVLTPVYWAYKLAGTELTWRLYSLPFFEDERPFYLWLANVLVWSEVALLAVAVRAALLAAASTKEYTWQSSMKVKAE